MKKVLVAVMVMIMAFAMTACGGSGGDGDAAGGDEYTADNPLVFKVAHVESTDTFIHQSLEKWKEYVEEQSEGRISVELYPNGELGGDEDIIQSILMDDVHMTIASASTLSPFDNKLSLLDLPFLFDNYEQMNKAINGGLGELYGQWMEESGFKCMGFQYDGARGLSNSKRPVAKLEDMKGLKVRVMQNDLYISLFKALGANPTPMSFNDLYTALQQGTVDGQDNSAMLTYTNNFYEVQDYYSTIETVFCNAVIITHKDFMEAIPEDLYAIMEEGAQEYLVKWQREQASGAEEDYLKKLDENGCAVTYIEDKTEFKEAVQGIYEEYRELVGDEVIDQVLELAEAAK